MKMLLLAFGLSLEPALAFADSSTSTPQPQSPDVRLVPLMQNGVFVGLKVYAVKPGSRFAINGFLNGDTIERVDDVAVTTDAGAKLLDDKVMRGTADAKVTVRRRGALITVTSRAR